VANALMLALKKLSDIRLSVSCGEGAVSDMEYNHLPDDVQKNLKEFSDSFK